MIISLLFLLNNKVIQIQASTSVMMHTPTNQLTQTCVMQFNRTLLIASGDENCNCETSLMPIDGNPSIIELTSTATPRHRREKRVDRDLDGLRNEGFNVTVIVPYRTWQVEVVAPAGSIHNCDGEIFTLTMEISSDHPFIAPKVSFNETCSLSSRERYEILRPIVHRKEWVPICTPSSICFNVMSLLSTPSPRRSSRLASQGLVT